LSGKFPEIINTILTMSTQSLDRIIYHGGDLPKPETNQNHFRLYGHTLCPFVGIARYALALKNVPF